MFNVRVWRGLWKTAATVGIAGTAIGAGIGVSGSVAGAAPTAASTAAANWLQAQLRTTNHYDTSTFAPTTPSVGLTVNGLLAFAAAGSSFTSDVTQMAGWLDTSSNVGGYIGSTGSYSSGGLANVALAASAAGDTPTSFAGTNLIADLESTLDVTGSFSGGFADPTIQALAIIDIEHSDPAFSRLSTAVAFLESQACTTHGGPYGYPSTYTPTFGACAVNPAGGEVDTTGAVSQALSYYGTTAGDPGAAAAAQEANAWLDTVKVSTGSTAAWKNFCTFTTFTVAFPSANSTALAVEGLVDDPTGPTTYAADVVGGVNWLQSAQDTTAGPTRGSLPACTASGPGNVRATTQGVQGLTGTSWTALL